MTVFLFVDQDYGARSLGVQRVMATRRHAMRATEACWRAAHDCNQVVSAIALYEDDWFGFYQGAAFTGFKEIEVEGA